MLVEGGAINLPSERPFLLASYYTYNKIFKKSRAHSVRFYRRCTSYSALSTLVSEFLCAFVFRLEIFISIKKLSARDRALKRRVRSRAADSSKTRFLSSGFTTFVKPLSATSSRAVCTGGRASAKRNALLQLTSSYSFESPLLHDIEIRSGDTSSRLVSRTQATPVGCRLLLVRLTLRSPGRSVASSSSTPILLTKAANSNKTARAV